MDKRRAESVVIALKPKKAKAEAAKPDAVAAKAVATAAPVHVAAKETSGKGKTAKQEASVSTAKNEAVKKGAAKQEASVLATKNEAVKKEAAKKEVVTKVAAKKVAKAVAVKKEPLKRDEAPRMAVKRETKSKEAEDDDEYRWWENQKEDDSVKWTTLEHNGPYFPPPYAPINVPLIYEGKELLLEPEAEEVAGFFGALINTDHAANDIFRRNFFDDFCAVLEQVGSRHAGSIRSLERCDFSRLHAHFEREREGKRNAGKAEKEEAKSAKKAIDEHHGYCLLDNRKEKVGNFRIEPPGLFRGRGKHPKAGKLKLRVKPEQVTINVSGGARVPDPPAGHQWAAVQHDNTVTWLATWTENVNRSQKYIYLAATSSLKGQSDFKKFETARELTKHVDKIRAMNREELHSKEMFIRQRATALWLIDHLALRAGNEKGDDEADTVGCCSLRLEHVQLRPPGTVVFDFLGKDSIRYYRELEVDPQIVKNLAIFMKPPKVSTDPIFDRLNTSMLNKYLGDLMPGLTAKVFRTYNASHTFQRELDAGTPAEATPGEKVLAFNRANRQVAILCNHQRSIPKTHGQAMERLKEKMGTLKYQRRLIRTRLKELVPRKEHRDIDGLDDDESDLEPAKVERLMLEREQEKRTKQQANEEGSQSASPGKSTGKDVVEDLKQKTANASRETLEKRLTAVADRISALRHQITDRDENKTTSLGTSKTNYLDPRITTAWCRRHGVAVEKMLNKSLREKFKWAMGVDKDWTF